jgi:hypothetical protein
MTPAAILISWNSCFELISNIFLKTTLKQYLPIKTFHQVMNIVSDSIWSDVSSSCEEEDKDDIVLPHISARYVFCLHWL